MLENIQGQAAASLYAWIRKWNRKLSDAEILGIIERAKHYFIEAKTEIRPELTPDKISENLRKIK